MEQPTQGDQRIDALLARGVAGRGRPGPCNRPRWRCGCVPADPAARRGRQRTAPAQGPPLVLGPTPWPPPRPVGGWPCLACSVRSSASYSAWCAAIRWAIAARRHARINPAVLWQCDDQDEKYEGCLSFFDVRVPGPSPSVSSSPRSAVAEWGTPSIAASPASSSTRSITSTAASPATSSRRSCRWPGRQARACPGDRPTPAASGPGRRRPSRHERAGPPSSRARPRATRAERGRPAASTPSRGPTHGADLHYSDLSGANLSGADLHLADLTGSRLPAAGLISANLHQADLWTTILWHVRLDDADPRGVDLTGADLSRGPPATRAS
jgi:hypothetical protein